MLRTIVLASLLIATGAAGAADAPAVLRVGLVAGPDGARAIKGISDIRNAYAGATGLQVRIFAASDMASLIEAQTSGRVHYAIYSAAGYAVAQAACACIEPLVAPIGSGGDVGLRSVVYARTGAAVSLSEAAGQRIVAGPMEAVGPQVLGLNELNTVGAGTDIMHPSSLGEAEAAFADGRADVLVGWEAAGGDPLLTGHGSAARLASLGMEAGDYAVLWQSGPVRYGPHAVRSDLPNAIKDSLRNFLVNLGSQSPRLYDLIEHRHLGGFVAVSPNDYAGAARLIALAAE